MLDTIILRVGGGSYLFILGRIHYLISHFLCDSTAHLTPTPHNVHRINFWKIIGVVSIWWTKLVHVEREECQACLVL